MKVPQAAAPVNVTVRRCVAFVLSGTWLGVVAAQEPRAGQYLEEVVVTAPHYVPTSNTAATKIEVPLIETPQSISVVTRDQVDLLNMQNLGQAVRYTSGIIGENFGADERYDWLTLRGFNPVQYIDGLQAPIGSVSNVGLDLYGFESVEVLKGPSSVLYGLTPPGGIVNMTSRRPQEEYGGEIQVQFGEHDATQVAGDITGPATDGLLYRLTALYRDRGTQMDHVNSERLFIAPSLTWKIAPTTTVTFLGYYQDDTVDGDGGGFLPAQGVVLPNPHGRIPVGRNTGEPDYNTYQREQYGIGYDFRHEFSDAVVLQQNLKYTAADVLMRSVYGAGLQPDMRTLNRSNFPFDEEVRSFGVDTRLTVRADAGGTTHTLLFGIDWRRYTNDSMFGFTAAPPIDIFEPVYGATPIVTPDMFPFTQQTQEQLGFYVQDQMKLGRWVFTLSGRHDSVEADNAGVETDDDEFSWRGGINCVFDSGFAPYVAWARSFQPTYGADFNGNPFVPTIGEQIEAGIKFEPRGLGMGRRAFFSLAAYELTQDNVLTPDPDPSHPFFNVQTGEVEVRGVELEWVARFHERLSLNGSYSYTDSEVTKSNGPDLGKRLTMVPEHKLSLLADYTFQTGRLAGFGFSVGVRYLSDSYGDPANEWRTPSVTLADVVVHYDRGAWHAALNGSNVFDKEHLSRCSSIDQCFYGLRRNVTLTVARRFQ